MTVTSNTSTSRQFFALVKKHHLRRTRDRAQLVNAFFTPLYYLFILIILNNASSRRSNVFSNTPLPYLTQDTCSPMKQPGCIHFAYVSSDSSNAVISELQRLMNQSEPNPVIMKGFNSRQELNEYYQKDPANSPIVVGADFSPPPRIGNFTLPNNLIYYTLLGKYSAVLRGFITTRVATLQTYMDRAIANTIFSLSNNQTRLSSPLPLKGSNNKDSIVQESSIPNPYFVSGTSFLLPYMIIFAFQPLFYISLSMVSEEKQSRLRGMLTAIGCSHLVYLASVWAIHAFYGTLISLIVSGIGYAGSLYGSVAFYKIFMVNWFFSLCNVSIGVAAGTVTSDVKKANSIAFAYTVSSLTLFGLFQVFIFGKADFDYRVEWLTFLSPPVGFARSMDLISQAAPRKLDMTFLLNDPKSPLARAVVMFGFSMIGFFVLAWYLDRLFPGPGDHGLPWWFPLSPSFWRDTPESSFVLVKAPTNLSEKGSDFIEVDNLEEPSVIEVKNLRKVYKTKVKGKRAKVVAVDNLNLRAKRDEILGILGHNGAGKTTAFSMITGQLLATAGQISVDGLDVPTGDRSSPSPALYNQLARVRSRLGICPQYDILPSYLRALEVLTLFAEVKGIKVGNGTREELESYLSNLLHSVDLDAPHQLQIPVSKFSGGMRRKVSVLLALMGDPKIVVLDEPTTGMDVYARSAVWKLIQESKQGRCVLLTTHSMEEADALSDRIAIISKGALKALGSSLFLKRQFGITYRLCFEKGEQTDTAALLKFVKSKFAASELAEERKNELVIALPADDNPSARFPQFFDELGVVLKQTGVVSMGLTLTTLEDVFMKFQHDDEE